jgi:hypothetical protein
MRQWIRAHLTYANVMVTMLAFVALGGTTYAATGGNLILGKPNSATNPTSLSAPVTGKALQVTNTKTSAGATALGLNVASGHAPFTVNSGAKVANLNADKLDNLDSSALYESSNVKSLVFNPGHLCNAASDTGCSATFSLGGLSLAASCFTDGNTGDGHLELENTSATTQVGVEYISGTSAHQGTIPAGQPIVDLDRPVGGGQPLQAQGTVINLADAKPEMANFVGSVQSNALEADCQLRLVGYKPQ